MTEFYDVERTITSLGTGEALVTALSPKGIPTALAATRLIPPDSLMAAIDDATFRTITAGSLLATKYGQTIDPVSAHEIITARLAAARQAAAAAAASAATAAGVPASTVTGVGMMTAAQQRKAIDQRAREIARAQKEAERERKAQARAKAAAERQRMKTIETSVRTAGRVVNSKAGQNLIRGIFGTLFGGGR